MCGPIKTIQGHIPLPLVALNVPHPHFEFSDTAKLKNDNFLQS